MGYDTVRYQYLNKLPFEEAPEDDRALPDLCLGLYDVMVFDHATKQVFAVHWCASRPRRRRPAALAEARRAWARWSRRCSRRRCPSALRRGLHVLTAPPNALTDLRWPKTRS